MAEDRLADRAYAGIVGIIDADSLSTGDRLPSEARLAELFGMSRAVVREALAVGDRLPSESRLAEMFGMSRTVVREALVRLASDGITEARRGAGSFVKSRPSDRLVAFMPIANLSATLGTYEVRFVLEAEAARLAAARRSTEEMAEIQAALDRLREALLSNAPAHAEDMALHRCIAAATANPAFGLAFEALFGDIERVMRAGVDISRSRPPQVIGVMMREHEMIVEAIRVQDCDAAALAMRWHLSEGRKRLLPGEA
jgi:DNA-binding FadR family transcriptional regulator